MSDDKETEEETPRRQLTPAQMVWVAWAAMTASLAVLLFGAGALGGDLGRCVLVSGGIWGVAATIASLCISVSSYTVKKCTACNASIDVSESNWSCGKCGKKDRENAAATARNYLTAAKFLFKLVKKIEQLDVEAQGPIAYRVAVITLTKTRHEVTSDTIKAAEKEAA